MEVITSKNNDKIKAAVKLRDSSRERREKGLFFVEGARLCCDFVLSGGCTESLFYTEKAAEKYSRELEVIAEKADRIFVITDEIAAKMSDTSSAQGIFCVNKVLDKSAFIDKIKYRGYYVALDMIQNPDNFGAISRTAEALGYDGIIVSGGCDRYNPKALRASMGSLFRLPVFESDNLRDDFALLQKEGMRVISTVPSADAVKITELTDKQGCILVIGNEGNGISRDILAVSDIRVTIPMRGRAESLNAAAAASICMWELIRP